MKFKTVYVDGDILLYEIAFATQKNGYRIYVGGVEAWYGSDKREINRIFKGIDYGYEKDVYVQPLLAAINTYKAKIEAYKKLFKTNDIRVVLTGSENFRNEVAVSRPYKGTRTQDKPYNYPDLKVYLVEEGAIVTVNEEADDYLSYMTHLNYNTVAVTTDKDAYNTPSYIYNPKKGELTHVSQEDADKTFWTQVLTGDSVDNIPGLPRVGKVTSEAILEGCTTYRECEQAVAMAYACHRDINNPEEYLTEQGVLLWMRREPEEMWRIGYDT